jgi:hypothetical protein
VRESPAPLFAISSRALGLAGLCALRILARGNRILPDLIDAISDWLEIGVFLGAMHFLDFIYRLEANDHDALGAGIACEIGDLICACDVAN